MFGRFFSFKRNFNFTFTDKKILCLGLIQSLFEGAMYTFVLEWTPALTPATKEVDSADGVEEEAGIPHGAIFAGFMVRYEYLSVSPIGSKL